MATTPHKNITFNLPTERKCTYIFYFALWRRSTKSPPRSYNTILQARFSLALALSSSSCVLYSSGAETYPLARCSPLYIFDRMTPASYTPNVIVVAVVAIIIIAVFVKPGASWTGRGRCVVLDSYITNCPAVAPRPRRPRRELSFTRRPLTILATRSAR